MAGLDKEATIEKIRRFKEALLENGEKPTRELRVFLNENAHTVRQEVIEAGCLRTFTIAPPPAVGGLVARDIDPFENMFESFWGRSLNSQLVDMLDRTIGVIRGRPDDDGLQMVTPVIESSVQKGFVFVAMPMAEGRHDFDDVLDAIKAGAAACGLTAERVDDQESNERITDRLLESIRRAEYVVVDLTDARPNVFYEAGYAQGLGKTPVYVARQGTALEFDLKDYPVIFFASMRELRERLEKRLRAIAANSVAR